MASSFGDQPRISIKWALALCYHVGFRHGSRLRTAVSVMWAESGRFPAAWNENLSDDGQVLSIDRGLFQINSIHDRQLPPEHAFEPLANAAYACELSNHGRHWSLWSAYKSGRWLLFWPFVTAVWVVGTWRSRIPKVEERFG